MKDNVMAEAVFVVVFLRVVGFTLIFPNLLLWAHKHTSHYTHHDNTSDHSSSLHAVKCECCDDVMYCNVLMLGCVNVGMCECCDV